MLSQPDHGDRCPAPAPELHDADAARTRNAGDGLDRSACVGVDAAADERRAGGVGVHDDVGLLGPQGARRAADEAVEQAAEEHHQHGDERQDDRGRHEAARSTTQLTQREFHFPTPAPVVATTGSMASTRRAASNDEPRPSASSNADHPSTTPMSKRSDSDVASNSVSG